MFADTRDIEGRAHGHMIIEVPDDPRQYDRVIAWLEEHHHSYQEEA